MYDLDFKVIQQSDQKQEMIVKRAKNKYKAQNMTDEQKIEREKQKNYSELLQKVNKQ